MSLILSESIIQKAKNDKEVVLETTKQVIKDFALFGVPIDFPQDMNSAYADLFNQLTVIVKELLEKRDLKLFNLLYQIDLSENKIRKTAAGLPEVPVHEIVTGLILDRELKKVLTRRHFSKSL